jgi:hypothetical protein
VVVVDDQDIHGAHVHPLEEVVGSGHPSSDQVVVVDPYDDGDDDDGDDDLGPLVHLGPYVVDMVDHDGEEVDRDGEEVEQGICVEEAVGHVPMLVEEGDDHTCFLDRCCSHCERSIPNRI